MKADTKLEALENEIAQMSTLQHPNIVKYVGTYSKGQELWIVMELMNAGKLTDLLMQTQFNEAEIATCCREQLVALKYMHENLRIHRDIKSDNILIDDQGNIKLGMCTQDFFFFFTHSTQPTLAFAASWLLLTKRESLL